jgi:hypothetical protein
VPSEPSSPAASFRGLTNHPLFRWGVDGNYEVNVSIHKTVWFDLI